MPCRIPVHNYELYINHNIKKRAAWSHFIILHVLYHISMKFQYLIHPSIICNSLMNVTFLSDPYYILPELMYSIWESIREWIDKDYYGRKYDKTLGIVSEDNDWPAIPLFCYMSWYILGWFQQDYGFVKYLECTENHNDILLCVHRSFIL